MRQEKHYKKGNSKIHSSCLISCLPTDVCFGKGKQCKGCYAKKSEIRFAKTVIPARYRKLKQTKQPSFVNDLVNEIIKSKRKVVRVHESGDFYSQDYIDKYVQIIKQLPDVKFYTYTKKLATLDFSELLKLDNFNLINSQTPLGLNYGDMEHCLKLVSLGYKLCPCNIEKDVVCMKDCTICASENNVCFLKH